MLEAIINPKSKERRPWKMFFIGFLYASLSLILVNWFFGADPVLKNHLGLLVVIFCVMFSLPFMYFLIKQEEEEDEQVEGFFSVWKIHSDAIYAFMFLFLGFIVAFSLVMIFFQNSNLFDAQLKTYCAINSPGSIEECFSKYSFTGNVVDITGDFTNTGRFLAILENNVLVMIFTLIFSLFFGAGAIFVLAWNATVIAAAIGVFTDYKISNIPMGLTRYMIHGFPEIAAYFITALAGGIFGVGMLRNMRGGFKTDKILRIVENTVILLFISILILIAAAALEVWFTPLFFN